MKLFSSLIAALTLVFAGCSGGDTHQKVADDVVHVMEHMATAMSSISDKASAEKAVADMRAAVADMKKLSERWKKLGEPTREVRTKIEAEFRPKGEKLGKAMVESMMQMVKAGPEALAILQAGMKELKPAMDEAGKMFK